MKQYLYFFKPSFFLLFVWINEGRDSLPFMRRVETRSCDTEITRINYVKSSCVEHSAFFITDLLMESSPQTSRLALTTQVTLLNCSGKSNRQGAPHELIKFSS